MSGEQKSAREKTREIANDITKANAKLSEANQFVRLITSSSTAGKSGAIECLEAAKASIDQARKAIEEIA